MLNRIFSPEVLGLLIGAFSLILGVSLCASLLDRKAKRRARVRAYLFGWSTITRKDATAKSKRNRGAGRGPQTRATHCGCR